MYHISMKRQIARLSNYISKIIWITKYFCKLTENLIFFTKIKSRSGWRERCVRIYLYVLVFVLEMLENYIKNIY